MNINITKKQYQKLIELLHIGEFIANGDRVEPIKEYEELQQYIYSFSQEYQCEDMIRHDEAKQIYIPTIEFEDRIRELVEDYLEEDFVENLVMKLSKRDAVREHGIEILESMELKDKMHAVMKYEHKYYNEIKRNGFENFKVDFLEK